MMKPYLPLTLILLAAPIGRAQSVPSRAEREVSYRVVTVWDQGCDGSTRTSWDNMIHGWFNGLCGVGNVYFSNIRVADSKEWRRTAWARDSNTKDSMFTDQSIVSWGRDDAGQTRPDRPDAFMLGLHGGAGSDDRWRATVRMDEAGDGNCKTWQGHMEFGDRDLEFLHLSSCHGLTHETWAQWPDSFGGVHQILGFHGVMWIRRGWYDRYWWYAYDAFDMPIATAWLDWQYVANASGSDDQCPVVMANGDGVLNTYSRLDHEQFDNVYPDPQNPNVSAVIWIGDCDPQGSGPLP
jgi:hypothetical protein